MNRKFIFLTLVLIGWVAILYKTIDTDWFYKKNISVKIYFKDDMPSDDTMESIKNILSYGKGFKHETEVDRVSFYIKDGLLKHPHINSIAKLNLKKDFFLVLDIYMDVLKDGSYDFMFKSNAVIAVSLDTKEVAKFDESKESKENKTSIFLSKGRHSMKLVYLQPAQAIGLEAWYKPEEEKAPAHLVGEDTDYISFSGITQ